VFVEDPFERPDEVRVEAVVVIQSDQGYPSRSGLQYRCETGVRCDVIICSYRKQCRCFEFLQSLPVLVRQVVVYERDEPEVLVSLPFHASTGDIPEQEELLGQTFLGVELFPGKPCEFGSPQGETDRYDNLDFGRLIHETGLYTRSSVQGETTGTCLGPASPPSTMKR
jgi:hypothetical protein